MSKQLAQMINNTEKAVQDMCGSDYADKIKENVEAYKRNEGNETKSRKKRIDTLKDE